MGLGCAARWELGRGHLKESFSNDGDQPMIATNDGTVTSFELSLVPDATLITTVRRFVGELCTRVLADADITSRVVVATHELLDNAVRYASRDASGIRVELQRLGEKVKVVIVTKNRLSDERGRRLRGLLDEMRASSDRAHFYRELLGRVARRVDGSGLGLGRVHAESELDVSGRFEEDLVLVRAEGAFPLTHGGPPR
jgi:Histidine kinase-like ATPase domain